MSDYEFKQMVLRLITKTDNPAIPMVYHNFMSQLESLGKIIGPVCDKEKCKKLQERLMRNFTDEELNGPLGGSPELLLSLLGMVKESALRFATDKVQTYE